MSKYLKITLPFALLALIGWGAFAYIWPKVSLFYPEYRVERFRSMEDVFPVQEISASPDPVSFKTAPTPLPQDYLYRGEARDLDAFLSRSQTTAFLVFHRGVLHYESYYQGTVAQDRLTSFSVAKSFVSTLVGIAHAEGLITSLEDPVSKYLPALAQGGYQEARIVDLLTMSSGVAFSEVYDDPQSDAYQIYNKLFLGMRGIESVVLDYPVQGPAGQNFHYASLDAQVLGLVVEAATGQPLGDYLAQKLWHPLGAESPASWVSDVHGTVLGFWGLNATARDFARLGLLFAQDGHWQGQRLLPSEWIARATRPGADYLTRGAIEVHWGYGFQWWLPTGADGDYVAIGIWGQFIYVDPDSQTVIVKLSADPDFKTHEPEAIAAFRAIAAAASLP